MIKVNDLIYPTCFTNNPSNCYTVIEVNGEKIKVVDNTTKTK